MPLSGRPTSVEELAARIAHEVNNPLSFVLTDAELLLEALERPGTSALEVAEQRRLLKEIIEGALRIRDVVMALRLLSPSVVPSGPSQSQAPPALPPLTPLPPSPRGEQVAARLLLIDDEPFILTALSRLLSHFNLRCAISASVALELIAQGPPPDVIICDLMMPGMTGMALFDEVLRRTPDLAQRFVFVTGGISTDEVQAFVKRVPNLVLEKPVSRVALLEAIATMLARSEQAATAG